MVPERLALTLTSKGNWALEHGSKSCMQGRAIVLPKKARPGVRAYKVCEIL